ncbi:YbjN domain-containing protein [Fulvivirga sp. M361]|uniref:YbjN domain-containing protein n=1 Tax=Fulvivirga sp. M361 TaxID=2594266 RepID=UPI00117ACF99|nr:YbjN domain-containing protein [Fulvivirga sp. M361]TRX62119.1 YbjN domain-containing protein [Fulvivirga sp. M361]
MDLNSLMKSYAEEIGGTYSEYDSSTSIIIVPLVDERFQTVLGKLKNGKRYQDRLAIEFTSKICEFNSDIDLKMLLEENANLNHAKFVIMDNFINIEASSFVETVTEEVIKEIIQEVANVADEYEFKLTGADVH